jgi:hypothetical protein
MDDVVNLDPDRVYQDVKDRAQVLYNNLGKDYDLTDLNENDRVSVMDWCTIMVRIEDLEREVSNVMTNDTSNDKWNTIEKINRILTTLRSSASTYQSDLSITRKARKGDNDTSVVAFIDNIKQRARQMLDERLSYIYCPKCRELLATTWFLFPDVNGGNSITLTCGRTLDNGKICGHRFTVTSKELSEKGNRNLTEVLPT